MKKMKISKKYMQHAKMVFMASMFKWRHSCSKETNFVFLQFVSYILRKLIEEVWLLT